MSRPPSEASSKVLIVRDRVGCGGGVYTLFEALRSHFSGDVTFLDEGRPRPYYGGKRAPWWQRSWLRLPVDAVALVWAIVRHQPDWVHLNTGLDKEERSLKRDAVNLWIAKLLGRRVLVQWHGWDHPAGGSAEFPGGNDGWLCRTYQKATAHLVLASAFREDLQRWGFRAPVHLGTTVVEEDVIGAALQPVSSDGLPMLLFLSRIERAKGLWELLDAYAELKRRNIPCGLTIAGDGPDLGALKARAAELGLADVSFPGFVRGEEKLECFRRASVFCFPSYSEGMPLAVLEALAMGLPIVASAVGGLADILCDGVHGFLLQFDPAGEDGHRFDPVIIANKVELLVSDPAMGERIGQENVKYAHGRFSPSAVTAELEGVYREAVAGGLLTR